jgi:hypothetical protein
MANPPLEANSKQPHDLEREREKFKQILLVYFTLRSCAMFTDK